VVGETVSVKETLILILTMLILIVAFVPHIHSDQTDQTISRCQLVSDIIPPNSHKVYNLSEGLTKASVFTMWFKVNSGGYSYVYLQRGTEIVSGWPVGLSTGMPIPLQYYYSCFVTRSGSYSLNVTTTWGESLNYTFFYDFNEPLLTNNTKSIPSEGGMASYYADLNSGDVVSLSLTSPSGSDFDIYVYFGYSYMMMSPPFAYTTSSNSPETLSLTAKNEGRYFIFVISSMGSGTFYLKSSIIPQAPTYDYDDLRAHCDSLLAELGNIRNLIYILITTTVISIATTVYFAARKPKVKPETETK
jgi:hypothetical protein